jgi:hypothetical protein
MRMLGLRILDSGERDQVAARARPRNFVVSESGKTIPAAKHAVDRFGDRREARETGSLLTQPRFQPYPQEAHSVPCGPGGCRQLAAPGVGRRIVGCSVRRSGHLSFLITTFGKPYTPNGFGNWFRDLCDETGCQPVDRWFESGHESKIKSMAWLIYRRAKNLKINLVRGLIWMTRATVPTRPKIAAVGAAHHGLAIDRE